MKPEYLQVSVSIEWLLDKLIWAEYEIQKLYGTGASLEKKYLYNLTQQLEKELDERMK